MTVTIGAAGNRIVPPNLWPIGILGVTASGKSSLAMGLARRRGDVEIVSIDSMQVYRGMDIGTAKPTRSERAEIVHHCLDLVEPSEAFDVATFQAVVGAALTDIASRGRRALLVGGTGLYLRSVVDALELPGRHPEILEQLDEEGTTESLHARLTELDPVAAKRMEPTNRRRILRALEVTIGSGRPFSSYGPGLEDHPPTPVTMLGLQRERAVVAERIAKRFASQMEAGFMDEVRALHAGPPLSRTARQALGYRELLDHLDAAAAGEPQPTLPESIDLAVTHTRQFAVRQDRWFRRDPRTSWIEPDHAVEALADLAVRLWGPAA